MDLHLQCFINHTIVNSVHRLLNIFKYQANSPNFSSEKIAFFESLLYNIDDII